MPVPVLPQVGPQMAHEGGIIEEERPVPPAFPLHAQVLIVGGHVQVLNVDSQRLGDAQSRLGEQPKEEPVARLGCGDRREDPRDSVFPHPTRWRWMNRDPFNPGHRVSRNMSAAICPCEEAGEGGLNAGTRGRCVIAARCEEGTQRLDRYRRPRIRTKATVTQQIALVRTDRMGRAISVAQVSEEVMHERNERLLQFCTFSHFTRLFVIPVITMKTSSRSIADGTKRGKALVAVFL